jgi:hypothetical protein
MNSYRLVRGSALVLPLAEDAARNLFLLSVWGLSVVVCGAQVPAAHTEPAMRCANTSKPDAGDVVVTNTCDFKITVQASTPGGTQLVRNLDSAGSASIAAPAHNPWRVFAGAWQGTPAIQAAGKGVTYATLRYECDVETESPQTQQAPSQPSDAIKTDIVGLYANAHPYMDEPLPELKKTVQELSGLKPAAGQEQLPDLLAKVGAKADELLKSVPDLISDESVSQTQHPISQGIIPGCSGTGCFAAGRSSGWDQNFSYLILTHPAPNGGAVLQEYRTARNGKPGHGTATPSFLGFVSAWIVFTSANRVESRFRYLGEQKTDGHNALVIGFAQIPTSVESPGRILAAGGAVPMLLQGIAWIDQSDFSIIRLHTDLLAPQPEIGLQRQTADIQFGPVHMPALALTLWLPQAVHAEMGVEGQIVQEEHKYSKYRLYRAKSKVIQFPNN